MATIEDCPNEILLHIFTFLKKQLVEMTRVCRRWDQLIVPALRFRARLHDEHDNGEREALGQFFRQYSALRIEFGASFHSTEAGDRTGLWILRRFPHATQVLLEFGLYCTHRILLFLDALGQNVKCLGISGTFTHACGHVPEPSRKIPKVDPLANLRNVFLSCHCDPLLYDWFKRNAPNIDCLKMVYCLDADIMIGHFAAQLEKLVICHLLNTETSYNHLKCPKLTTFSLEWDNSSEPIELDEFLKNSPQIRHFHLSTDNSCQDTFRAIVKLPNLEVLTLKTNDFSEDYNEDCILFQETDNLRTLKTLSLECEIKDVPQLPALQNLFVLENTHDRFYLRLIDKAPNLTHLVVDNDSFLDNDSLVTICTGLTKLVKLHLGLHRGGSEIDEQAFSAIHLLNKLQHFSICFQDIDETRWLGEWFHRLVAPTVTVGNDCVYRPSLPLMPFEDMRLLLGNPQMKVLSLYGIRVEGWRRLVAVLRPEIQVFYCERPWSRQRQIAGVSSRIKWLV